MLIMVAILVVVVIISFIGILSRYRKCKSDEVLVVYGKTSGESLPSFIMEVLLSYGRLFKDTNSSP